MLLASAARFFADCNSLLSEQRTVHILIIPLTAFGITHIMSYLNDHDPLVQPLLENLSIQQDHKSFDPLKGGGRDNFAISSVLNYRDREPWAQWAARWGLWHLAFVSITSFKLKVLPEKMAPLCVTYGLSMAIVQWSGFRQWSTKEKNAEMEGTQLQIHGGGAVVLFGCNIIETLTVWWPSRMAGYIMAGAYSSVFGFIYALVKSHKVQSLYCKRTGLPSDLLVEGKYPVVVTTLGLEAFEYMRFAAHLFIVWHRAPAVLEATQKMLS